MREEDQVGNNEGDSDEDGATRAFDQLRAEIASLRKAIEALPAALEALEPVDYAPSFGTVAKVLDAVDRRLGVMEQHPALRLTPDQHSRAIIQAGGEGVREMARALREETDAIRREIQNLAEIVGEAQTREVHKRTLLWMLGAGLGGGMILFPLLGAFAPGGSYLAAWATGNADRWQAGVELLQVSNPSGAQMFATASRLFNANSEVLRACFEAARKADREQRCSITVSAP
jgi:Family of unknown function (DUF6118)